MWEHQKEKVPKEEGRTRRLKHKSQQHTAKCILPSFRISQKQGARKCRVELALPKKRMTTRINPKNDQLLSILHSCNQSRTRFLSTILSFDVFILASPAKVLSMIFPTRPRNSSSCKISNACLGQLPCVRELQYSHARRRMCSTLNFQRFLDQHSLLILSNFCLVQFDSW